MSRIASALAQDGFVVLPQDPGIARWAQAAFARARDIAADPEQIAQWLRCEGTWFVGVDVLDNRADGSVSGTPFPRGVMDTLSSLGLAPPRWHAAQVSVVYPGYPKPQEGESEAAARYRIRRDAAHVDGLLPVGPERRRVLGEPHAFILGMALNAVPKEASPLVVWKGSHKIIGKALTEALKAHPEEAWGQVDLTDVYSAARKECFETCARVPVPIEPGQASLLHRHALHGMGPWPDDVEDVDGAGRMIAYFRPQFETAADWAIDA